uniref:Uncharacterized protein n=1 Tax=Caenorhabditis japonica TaxID=281687 RepID=A0A8R1E983_CAEJA
MKFSVFLCFLSFAVISESAPLTHVTVKTNYDQQIINLIVWICPDPTLFSMIQSALQQYRTVDDINKSVQSQISGYRSAMWLVNTINYSRTTAKTTPESEAGSQNLCFIQAPDEELVVFVAALVS